MKQLAAIFIMLITISGWAEEKKLEQYSQELVTRASAGDSEAQYNLGCCYSFGMGISKNAVEAFQWYKKAAIQGNADAQCSVGACYAGGLGTVKDESLAFDWIKKAAEQNNPAAEYGVGVAYCNGMGVTKNDAEGKKWLQKAADKGNQMACLTLKQLEQRPPQPYSDKLLKKAESGDALAQYNLAGCYLYGQGVAIDKAEAIRWLRKSADSGDSFSQYSLGVIYIKGLGCEKNEEKGLALIKEAAEHGNDLAKIIISSQLKK